MRTDRQRQTDMTKLIGVFCDYANAFNNDRPLPMRFSNSFHHHMQWFLHILAPQNEPFTITGHHYEVSTCVCVRAYVLYICIFQWLLLF